MKSTKEEVRLGKELLRFKRYLKFRQFLSHVVIGSPNECWYWTGYKNSKGYGVFRWAAKHLSEAHVAAYELFIGSRHGKNVCHSCDNPSCVNPFHLWLGTQKENLDDMRSKGRRKYYSGEDATNAKLTLENVDEIRSLYRTGRYHFQELANRFGVSKSCISYAINENNWKM